MKTATKKVKVAAGWSRQVEAICGREGLQLTPLRKRVLSILNGSQGPLGAYAIIEKLSKVEGKQIAPPTVYRTLEFFVQHGFVHKVETLNAFAPCEHVGHSHHGVLLLCEKCGRSEEVEHAELDGFLKKMTGQFGFHLRTQILELQGLCKSCSPAGLASPPNP